MTTNPPLLDVTGGRVVPVATFFKASALIGSGRFAEVYRAYDSHAETDVALKLYRAADPASHQVAKNEQSTLLRLETLNSRYFPRLRKAAKHRIRNANHPLLVMELGTYRPDAGGKPIISLKDAMQAISQRSDSTELLGDFWTAQNVVSWLIKVVQGVALMHSADIIHRDLKPANVLLRLEAGQSEVVPFFLDFNSAAGPDTSDVRSGTPPYLPPEVRSGHRSAPAKADDIWAAGMLGWEMVFGSNSSVEPGKLPLGSIRGPFPEAIPATLLRALSLKPADRFQSADEFLAALQEVRELQLAAEPKDQSLTPRSQLTISDQEFASSIAAAPQLVVALEEALAPAGDIVIPKTVADAVSTLLSWLNEEQTQSLDLVGDLVRLGPRALPVCLEQGFKIPFDSRVGDEIIEALRQLARDDVPLAEKAVNAYALSSNVAVRTICRRLCDEVEILPSTFVESLTNDEGILLPEERMELADLCLRYGRDSGPMLALSKYLCREYILGPSRYALLSKRIATRMGAMPFSDKALLIVEDTADHIWEELPEFERLAETRRPEVERGLLELMADAFASMGEEALKVFKDDNVPVLSNGASPLPLFRRFALKLASKHPPTREWLLRQADDDPGDPVLRGIAEKLRATSAPVELDDLRRTFELFVAHGYAEDLNVLRFSQDLRLFRLMDDLMVHRPAMDEIDRLLALLKGFQSRQRYAVVGFVLRHWKPLSGRDYALSTDILTTHGVPDKFRDVAVAQFNKDLKGPHERAAREALERILS
jgi:serine/threonine protein kinase